MGMRYKRMSSSRGSGMGARVDERGVAFFVFCMWHVAGGSSGQKEDDHCGLDLTRRRYFSLLGVL